MNLRRFLLEKIPFLIASFFFLMLCGCLLWAFLPDKWAPILFLFVSFWLVFQLPFLFFEYNKKRRFYNELFERLSQLDNKNYIGEMFSSADFIDAEILEEIIRICNKSYLDDLAVYKSAQENYREYIELWVHEIKTPLAWGMLSLENAQAEMNPQSYEKTSGAFEEIEHKVQQVLYYARSNSVEKDFQMGEIRLSDLCQTASRQRARLLITHQVRLSFLNLDHTVYSDSKWLLFILGQLLDNAVKYKGDTPLVINFESYIDSSHIILRITDNGIGILGTERPYIFEKGFTGSHGHHLEKSTGMGLYICRKLACRLGIELRLAEQSSDGEAEVYDKTGTAFEICFPHDTDRQADFITPDQA